MKVALYGRVSTIGKGQDLETQLMPLRTFSRARKWEVYGEYVDEASGKSESREALDRLMEDARKRKFDVVLVFRFDRFARSVKHLIVSLETFKELGIDFASYSENMDTTTSTGKLMFTLIGAFAEFEREVIRERVLAGLSRAKAKGKRLGRPPVDPDTVSRVRRMRGSGMTVRGIAKELGMPNSTVFKLVKGG